MDNFIRIYSDLESTSNRVLDVLLRTCLKTLLSNHQHRDGLVDSCPQGKNNEVSPANIEYEMDGECLVLKKGVHLKFSIYRDGEHRSLPPKIVNRLRYRYTDYDKGVMMFDAIEDHYKNSFDVQLSYDDEDLCYRVYCSQFSAKHMCNLHLTPVITLKSMALEEESVPF
jgi:hypothetical protein